MPPASYKLDDTSMQLVFGQEHTRKSVIVCVGVCVGRLSRLEK